MCVCEKETVPALAMATQPFSLNQPEQLVSGVDAGHIMHTHTHRPTHTLTHTETAGPTLGQRQACDVRPEDRCGQTSPSSALLLLPGNTQQMAEAQPPFSSPLSHFLLSLLPSALPSLSIHSSTPTLLSLSVPHHGRSCHRESNIKKSNAFRIRDYDS